MADDILDDLDKELEDDMEDILEEASLDDLDSDDDDLDQDDSGQDQIDDDPEEVPGKKTSIKQIVAKLTAKIPDKLKTKKVLIIMGAAALLLVLLVVGLMIFVFGNDKEPEVVPASGQPAVEGSVNPEQEIVFEDIVELAPFERIHLKTSSTMGLISLNVSLELTDYRFRKQIFSMEERLRQIVETQVSEMTWLELRNPEGKIRLKYELLKRMNSLFPKTTVRNIYFTYFIMQ